MFSNKIAFNRGNFFLLFFMHFTLFSAHLIGQTDTTTILSASPNPANPNQTVFFSVTVTPTAMGLIMLTNTTTGRNLAIFPLGPMGQGGYEAKTGDLVAGDNEVTATFVPADPSSFNGSSDTVDVVFGPTTIILSASPNPAPDGSSVALSVAVTPPTIMGFVMLTNITTGSSFPNIVVGPTGQANYETKVGDLVTGQNVILATFVPADLSFAESSSTVTVTINESLPPPILLPPPRHLQGIQKVKGRSSSSSHSSSHTKVVNILTWKAPKGDTPVAYRIFRSVNNRNTKLIAEVPGTGKLEFKDHQVKEGNVYTYSVVSVGAFGDVSEPALVTIK